MGSLSLESLPQRGGDAKPERLQAEINEVSTNMDVVFLSRMLNRPFLSVNSICQEALLIRFASPTKVSNRYILQTTPDSAQGGRLD
jgi:hypothetical protein